MYFLFLGHDISQLLKKRNGMLSNLLEKKPGSEVVKISPDNWDISRFESLIGALSLFENKCIVLTSFILEDRDRAEQVMPILGNVADSENAFMFLEKEIHPDILKVVRKDAQEVIVTEELSRPESKFNVFALADALGLRDKKTLWVLYQRALREGISGEQLHGTFFWQIKMMVLAGVAKSAKEAGVSEFPFNKARRYLKNFSRQELESFSSALVNIYHDSHRGLYELDSALERFILSI